MFRPPSPSLPRTLLGAAVNLAVTLAATLAPGACEAAASEPHDEAEYGAEGKASAGCDHKRCLHGGEAKKHTSNLLGAKVLLVGSLAETGTAPMREHGEPGHVAAIHSGLVVFYERELIVEWLELELNVGMVSAHEGLRVPIDLLAKKPFHVAKRATLYVGVGPSLEFFTGGQPPLGGVTGGFGSYLWLSKNSGIDVEIDYTAHFLLPGIEHVVTVGLGPVLHF